MAMIKFALNRSMPKSTAISKSFLRLSYVKTRPSHNVLTRLVNRDSTADSFSFASRGFGAISLTCLEIIALFCFTTSQFTPY